MYQDCSDDDLDLFYGSVKYGKMLIYKISWEVLKILDKKVIRVVLMSRFRQFFDL